MIGIETAAITVGGLPSPHKPLTQEYDGTSWTSKADLATGRAEGGGAGTTSAGLYFGGSPGPAGVTITEEFTGTLNTSQIITTS